MTEKELRKMIKKYDPTAELHRDSFVEYRIFLFAKSKRYPIAASIDKKKDWKIKRISDYDPLDATKPKVVISLEKQRIWGRPKKTIANNESPNDRSTIKKDNDKK